MARRLNGVRAAWGTWRAAVTAAENVSVIGSGACVCMRRHGLAGAGLPLPTPWRHMAAPRLGMPAAAVAASVVGTGVGGGTGRVADRGVTAARDADNARPGARAQRPGPRARKHALESTPPQAADPARWARRPSYRERRHPHSHAGTPNESTYGTGTGHVTNPTVWPARVRTRVRTRVCPTRVCVCACL